MTFGEFETFYAKVTGAGPKDKYVKRVTVPKHLCKFMGLKIGDTVKVMVRKSELLEKE